MTGSLPTFGAGLLALAAHVILLLVALRLRIPGSPIAAHVICGLAGAVLVVGSTLGDGRAGEMWRSAALFAFGWAILLFLYSALYKSVSVRLLLTAAHGGSASRPERADRILRKGIGERVDLLILRGLVEQESDAYRLTPEGNRIVRAISALRTLFAATTGGMYGFGRTRRGI